MYIRGVSRTAATSKMERKSLTIIKKYSILDVAAVYIYIYIYSSICMHIYIYIYLMVLWKIAL